MTSDRERGLAVGAAMALLALGIAGALVPFRDSLANANVALVLMAVVVCAAAMGGRLAGFMTAITAGLAFNFFHTKPYQSLAIHSNDDIITFALLIVGGIVVGELAARYWDRSVAEDRLTSELRSVERLVADVTDDRPLRDVWTDVRSVVFDILGAVAVWFEADDASASAALPRLDSGVAGQRLLRWVGSGFALPAEGAQLPVESLGHVVGRVVVRPRRDRPVSDSDRRIARTAVALLALAITRRPAELRDIIDVDECA